MTMAAMHTLLRGAYSSFSPKSTHEYHRKASLKMFSRIAIRLFSSSPRENQKILAESKIPILQNLIQADQASIIRSSNCNIPPHIAARVLQEKKLHLQKHHPLNIIKAKIETYFTERYDNSFQIHDNFMPIVSTDDNFDSLLIKKDHVSRSKSDTYYVDNDTVLRTHTSAHQLALLQDRSNEGCHAFLCTGDVYRRDEIDRSHYPIFHQMEGVMMFQADKSVDEVTVEMDLKDALEGMTKVLFGDVEMRWVDAYFPFTNPSAELEIYFEGEWLEVLGCGVIEKDIVKAAGRGDQPGWAFGLGLERLAMVLFSIPDIRLFWSTDSRFHEQFTSGDIIKFQPYSKFHYFYIVNLMYLNQCAL